MEVFVALMTNGVMNGQGRTKLSAKLSAGMSMPLALGTVGFMVYWCHAQLPLVAIGSAASSCVQAAIVAIFFRASDWPKYAEETMQRQMVSRATSAATEQPEAAASEPSGSL